MATTSRQLIDLFMDPQKLIDKLIPLRFPGMSNDFELSIVGITDQHVFDDSDDAIIEEIVGLGFLLDLKDENDPLPSPTGNYAPAIGEVREWLNKVFEYRIALEESTTAGLIDIYEKAIQPLVLADEKRAADRDKNDFFSLPHANADYSEWLRFPGASQLCGHAHVISSPGLTRQWRSPTRCAIATGGKPIC